MPLLTAKTKNPLLQLAIQICETVHGHKIAKPLGLIPISNDMIKRKTNCTGDILHPAEQNICNST
jgi:hypothetical protein